ncbi:MAG: VCBS repeat-containing protein [Nannocystaceae bacterium]|nr:VCBS repeat-containing protein [Deltaproteobacteria bacterium]MBP7289723.1 VCBS repeat-containing protein [Nannocystaceae bacterium]
MLADVGTKPSLPEGCEDGVAKDGEYCFELVEVPAGDRAGLQIEGAAALDLDGDGAEELIYAFSDGNDAPCAGEESQWCSQIYRWSGTEFTEIGEVTGGAQVADPNGSPYYTVLDFDGDGRRDLVVTHLAGLGYWEHRADGTLAGGGGWKLGDYIKGGAFPYRGSDEGFANVLVALDEGMQVHRWDGATWNPEGALLPLPNCLMYPGARGDLDEDGMEDVVVLGDYNGCEFNFPNSYAEDPEYFAMPVLLTDRATGLLEPAGGVLPGEIPRLMWLGDLDGDGHLDVLFGVYGSGFSWARGLGDGSFEPAELVLELPGETAPELPAGYEQGWSPQGLADFDGDGVMEVLVRGSVQPPGGNAGQATMRFIVVDVAEASSLEVYEQPFASAEAWSGKQQFRGFGDFNGDGVTDFAVWISDRVEGAPSVTRPAVWISRP